MSMTRTLLSGICIATLSFLVSCSSVNYPRAHLNNVNEDISSLSYTADLRATHIIRKNGEYKVLMEPAPDAAFSYDEKANLNWALVSMGGNAREEYDSGEADLPLTGRTSAVLIARELGYRISEISINTNADSKDTIKLYEKALSLIEKIAEAEAEKVSYNGTVHVNTGSSSSLEFKNNNGASDADLNSEDSQPASDNIAIPSSTETEKKKTEL